MSDPRPKICDYEGSNYRTEFWETHSRRYEDIAERHALHKLLGGVRGKRLLEIGAGFGRLSHEYSMFDQVVLLDYSFSQLQYARQQLGDRFIYVAADIYHLPFRAGMFDGAAMIRVIHHMADVPTALEQVRRVLAPQATFILEHANKRNAKAMLRYAFGKQNWNPYTLPPVEFVELNFDFHPTYIQQALMTAQFDVGRRMGVSFFRLGALKERIPAALLAGFDSALQGWMPLVAPSVFVRATANGTTPNNIGLQGEKMFICPQSGGELHRDGDTLISDVGGVRWAVRDGIYDFKAPIDN
jgi:SAM-dependent methyltransferase